MEEVRLMARMAGWIRNRGVQPTRDSYESFWALGQLFVLCFTRRKEKKKQKIMKNDATSEDATRRPLIYNHCTLFNSPSRRMRSIRDCMAQSPYRYHRDCMGGIHEAAVAPHHPNTGDGRNTMKLAHINVAASC
jgi:hypothetical protein